MTTRKATEGREPHPVPYVEEREVWMEDAACVGMGDLMFPHRGEDVRPAKAVCAECSVREVCLQYAFEHGEHWGIWGGMSERERRQIRERRNRLARSNSGRSGVRLGHQESGAGAALTARPLARPYTEGTNMPEDTRLVPPAPKGAG